MTIDTITVTAMTDTERRRGMSWSAPSSAAARMFHTPPGMYLPSWEMKKMRKAAVSGSVVPMSANSTRQANMVSST